MHDLFCVYLRYNSSSVRISSVSLQDFHLLLLYEEKIWIERLSLDLRRVSHELSLNLDHRLKRDLRSYSHDIF